MHTDPNKKDIDPLTGVETTGHEWDGMKELNNPAPRWWLWVFYVTVIWSVAYFVLYPAWPTPGGATKGMLGYTQDKELAASQQAIMARQANYLAAFEKADYATIMKTPELYQFAKAGGAAAFKDNCATCHGTGGAGGKGYPNLNDDDWLWGGSVEEIETTLLYGIRSGHEDARISQMPAFGQDKMLTTAQIDSVVDFVLTLSGGKATAGSAEGAGIFAEQCASCHGADGRGLRSVGAPNLADKIWLYGGTRADVYQTVYNARAGVMPHWVDRLDRNTIRQLAVYVHELGGGEASLSVSVPETQTAPAGAPESAPASEPTNAP